MTWFLAPSLVVLRNEVNALAAGRSKASDGTIGNAEHAARHSDHNPNAAGVVCAFDVTHNTGQGLDCEPLFQHIRAHPHPSATYVIFNRRIALRDSGWAIRTYTGPSAHTEHMHVSASINYGDTSPWGIGTPAAAPPAPAPPKLVPSSWPAYTPPLMVGPARAADGRIGLVQVRLNTLGFGPLKVDGLYGPLSMAAVRRFQLVRRLTVDSKIGPLTWAALGH